MIEAFSASETLAQALREVYAGRLAQAAALCRAGPAENPREAVGLRALLGLILVEQGEFDAAGEEIRAGLADWPAGGGDTRGQADLLALYYAQARTWRLAGDWEEALEITEMVAAESDPVLGQGMRADILSQRGDTSWVEEEAARTQGSPPPMEEEDLCRYPWTAPWRLWGNVWVRVSTARARRLRASRDLSTAMAVLQPVLVYLMQRMSRAERDALVHRVIELAILQSLAMDALGDRLRALVAVERAVTLAQPGGYASVFYEEGEPMQYLLEALRAEAVRRGGPGRRDRSPVVRSAHAALLDYLNQLLGAFPGQGKRRKAPIPPLLPAHPVSGGARQGAGRRGQPLSAELTPREEAILRFLFEGQTYQEIADRLFLSLATVRWHVRSLYRKLGVSSRERAIARGREMNML